MISSLERVILVDIDNHHGTTKNQTIYRLINHSPFSLSPAIERLIRDRYIEYNPILDIMVLTESGRAAINPWGESV